MTVKAPGEGRLSSTSNVHLPNRGGRMFAERCRSDCAHVIESELVRSAREGRSEPVRVEGEHEHRVVQVDLARACRAARQLLDIRQCSGRIRAFACARMPFECSLAEVRSCMIRASDGGDGYKKGWAAVPAQCQPGSADSRSRARPTMAQAAPRRGARAAPCPRRAAAGCRRDKPHPPVKVTVGPMHDIKRLPCS